jgi:hypothetical protein
MARSAPASGPAPSAVPPAWPDEVVAQLHGASALVILPTLNEEEGLERTLSELRAQRLVGPDRRVEVLIVDGGSTDRTLDVARAGKTPAVRQQGRGKGAAVLQTIEQAYALGIPYAVVLDADATYPPDRVLDAVDLLAQSADLVVGVRRPVAGPAISARELIHRLGNIGLSYTASAFSRRTIFDLCSGFWGVATERFVALGLEQAAFAIEAELVLEALRHDLRVVQIPVEYRERVGEAKLHAVRDGSRILLTILRHGPTPRRRIPPNPADPQYPGQLLSIGLITGSRRAVLECAPSDSAAATDLARVLRRNFPETVVQVAPKDPPPPPSAAPPDEPGPTPMIVSLSAAGSVDAGARAVAVSIGSFRRQLTIELPPTVPPPGFDGEEHDGGAARSGARAVPRRGSRGNRFPSLEVLTSRLSYDRIDQQRAMLSANGFRVVERGRGSLAALTEPVGEA